MSHPVAPTSLDRLNKFRLDKVLNDDPLTHTLTLLGTLPGEDTAPVKAIVRIEKTAWNSQHAGSLLGEDGLIHRVNLEESTDIVCVVPSQSFRSLTLDSIPGFLGGCVKIGRGMSKSTSSVQRRMCMSARYVILPFHFIHRMSDLKRRAVHETGTAYDHRDSRVVRKSREAIYRGFPSS